MCSLFEFLICIFFSKQDVNGDGMLHWDLDELQEAISSDSQSDVGESLSAEEGYEADSEREKEGTISGGLT